MPDARFFPLQRGPFTLSFLAEKTGGNVVGDPGFEVSSVESLETAHPGSLAYVREGYLDRVPVTKAGALLVSRALYARLAWKKNVLLHEKPYAALAQILKLFYEDEEGARPGLIHPTAVIDPTAQIAPGVCVGPYSVIGGGACLGEGTVLEAHVVLGPGVQVGAYGYIESHAVLSHCLVGTHVYIKRGACIGQKGFGFFSEGDGLPLDVPQMGRVILEDYVEVGANTTIDRGSLRDTVVGRGTRIDNLVQVGHNVEIGSFSIIAAQTGLSGSVKLGKGCALGGQVGIAGHLTLGDGTKIAAQSGVVKNSPGKETLGGSPAVPIVQWHRQTAYLKKLSRLAKETASEG